MDVEFFGRYLADLTISGAAKASRPPLDDSSPCTQNHSPNSDDPLDDDDQGGGRGGGEPGNPDDQAGAQAEDPEIQVPCDDPDGAPGDPGRDPGGDGARLDIPVLEEHPTLHNIYLCTWIQ